MLNTVAGLDLETTGKLATGHRIIEVCVSKWLISGTHLSTQTWRINPERAIDPKAQEVHGISAADLLSEPKREIVFPLITKALADVDLIVAHNGLEFDKLFLEMDYTSVGLVFPKHEWFDTMIEGRWATPMGKVPSLQELCHATGVKYDPSKAHAAEYDTNCMMEAFFRGKQMGFFNV